MESKTFVVVLAFEAKADVVFSETRKRNDADGVEGGDSLYGVRTWRGESRLPEGAVVVQICNRKNKQS